MHAKIGSFISILLTIYHFGYSQTYSVFTPVEVGKVLDGEKAGIWSYYDSPSQLSLQIDYSKPELLYVAPDTSDFVIKDEAGNWIESKLDIPTRFMGSYLTLIDHYKKMTDLIASMEVNSKVEIELVFEVGPDGIATNPIVNITKQEFADEVLKLFHEAPNLWVAGTKDGKMVTSRFQFSLSICRGECSERSRKLNSTLAKPMFIPKYFVRRNVFIGLGFALNYGFPTWSPDGSKILFHATKENEDRLFVIDKDGSDLYQIPYQVKYGSTVWSLDNNSIFFDYRFSDLPFAVSKFSLKNKSVQTIDADNSFTPVVHQNKVAYNHLHDSKLKSIRIRQLKPPFSFEEPHELAGNIIPLRWNKDGTKLIVSKSDEEYSSLMIYDVKDNSTTLLPVLKTSFCDWSPDESKVLLNKFEYKNQLFMIDLRDKSFVPITSKLDDIHHVRWLKTNKIAYIQYNNLFIMNLDGTDKQKLLTKVFSPDWNSDGDTVVYIDGKNKELKTYNVLTGQSITLQSN